MSIKKAGAALLIASSIGTAFANVCITAPGKIVCGSGEVDHLSGNGVVKVSGTSINGLTSVNGALSADNAHFTGIDVNGKTSLMQCLVKGDVSIKGVLEANATKFDSSIDLHTGKSNFNKSIVKGDLNIRKTSDVEQIVYIENSSEIDGDVIFDSGQGEVILSSDSRIKGSVIGGNVVNKN